MEGRADGWSEGRINGGTDEARDMGVREGGSDEGRVRGMERGSREGGRRREGARDTDGRKEQAS